MAKTRLHEIDGLRGWAALCVVLFHFFWETFGAVHPQMQNGLLKLFMDGPLAVFVFFILSGDALATATLSDPSLMSWRQVVAKRYLRLTLPIFLVTLITCAVMAMGLIFSHEAGALLRREAWLGLFLQFEPSLATAIRFSFADAVGWNANGGLSYNAFLWSIPVEWVGSLLVLLSAPVLMKTRSPAIGLALLFLVSFFGSAYLSLFVVGMMFAFAREAFDFPALRASNIALAGSCGLLILAYLLDWWRKDFAPASGSLAGPLDAFFRAHYGLVLGTLIVTGCTFNRYVVRCLCSPLSIFMGRISYPLFLIQFLVLCSVLSGLVVLIPASARRMETALMVGGVALVVALVAAWALSLIEERMLRYLSRATRWMFAAAPVKPARPGVPN